MRSSASLEDPAASRHVPAAEPGLFAAEGGDDYGSGESVWRPHAAH